jgi:hypothetical protein
MKWATRDHVARAGARRLRARDVGDTWVARAPGAIGVDDGVCGEFGRDREIADRCFDVGDAARQVGERLGVVSLPADDMRDLGEGDRPEQQCEPASEDRTAARRLSPSAAEGATRAGVEEVIVMMAMVRGQPGGRNGH